jgi:hypothetical protein
VSHALALVLNMLQKGEEEEWPFLPSTEKWTQMLGIQNVFPAMKKKEIYPSGI